MNLPSLAPLPSSQVKKYLPMAIELTLKGHLPSASTLSKRQKVIVTKIHSNLNLICKLNIKEIKELLKQEPQYQQALADLYFDKKINNYILITNHEKTTHIAQPPLLQQSASSHDRRVIDVQYRIQFTISNIARKSVMKPVVLIVFGLKNGQKVRVYYNLEEFAVLREQVANSMRQVYGVELRAL